MQRFSADMGTTFLMGKINQLVQTWTVKNETICLMELTV